MSGNIALLLDGIILVFLAVTIFYAARLSIFLKVFRQERSSMLSLIKDLSATIDKAEASIATMKKNAGETEDYVTGVMKEAKFLADELSYMTQSGDKLANRLEQVADRNKELVDLIEKSDGINTHQKAAPNRDEIENEDPFEIFDFDIEDDLDIDDEADFLALEDGAYRATMSSKTSKEKDGFNIFDKEFSQKSEKKSTKQERQFYSQAEQDLYEALQRRKHIQEAS